MSREIIEFCAIDDIILNGYINKGENKTDKVLIAIHGMTSNCFKSREKIIAQEIEKIGIDTICFNNRGSEILKYIKKKNGEKTIAGTAFENIEECYFDILGAIKYAVQLGYTSIYLQGHSLGSTKIIYTYKKLQEENSEFLKYIKGIILLSLVDIPDMINSFTKPEFIQYALNKEIENDTFSLMPINTTIHPLSVNTFLRYAKYNENINFARFSDDAYDFNDINNIKVPLFMRWGSYKELIKKDAKSHVEFFKTRLINDNVDVDYIEGANHSYAKKEKILAEQIKRFLKDI